MTRSIFTERYRYLKRFLKQKRKEKKLTQWDLSTKLNMPLSYVGKYEQGERRLDLIEIMDIAEILDFDMVELVSNLKKIKNQ